MNTINLIENFISVQGEGKFQGRVSSFLRFKDCNLSCDFCFGVRSNGKIPKLISTGDKPYINITDLKKGDKIYTYNIDRQLVQTNVTDIYVMQIDKWYQLKTSENHIYYVSPNHLFATENGMTNISDITPEDKIISINFPGYINIIEKKFIDIEKSSKTTKLKPLDIYVITCDPYESYIADGMWVHNCDTNLRMIMSSEASYDIDKIIDLAFHHANGHFVITGGEPTLPKYHDKIINFMYKVYKKYENKSHSNSININPSFEIETNGYKLVELIEKIQNQYKDNQNFLKFAMSRILIDYSPKNYFDLIHDNTHLQIINIINKLVILGIDKHQICLKLVVDNEYIHDLQNKSNTLKKFILNLINAPAILKDMVYIMPKGETRDKIMDVSNIYKFCINYGINFTSRIHIIHSMF